MPPAFSPVFSVGIKVTKVSPVKVNWSFNCRTLSSKAPLASILQERDTFLERGGDEQKIVCWSEVSKVKWDHSRGGVDETCFRNF